MTCHCKRYMEDARLYSFSLKLSELLSLLRRSSNSPDELFCRRPSR